MRNTEETRALVEQALRLLDIAPESARNEEAGQWTIYRDNLELYIDVWGSGNEQHPFYYYQAEDQPIFQVLAPFCFVPADRQDEFMAELLDINIGLLNACLAMRQDEGVVCVKIRTLSHYLTAEAITEALDTVAYYAALFSQAFQHKYKVQLMHRPEAD